MSPEATKFRGGSFGPLHPDVERGIGAGGVEERSANPEKCKNS